MRTHRYYYPPNARLPQRPPQRHAETGARKGNRRSPCFASCYSHTALWHLAGLAGTPAHRARLCISRFPVRALPLPFPTASAPSGQREVSAAAAAAPYTQGGAGACLVTMASIHPSIHPCVALSSPLCGCPFSALPAAATPSNVPHPPAQCDGQAARQGAFAHAPFGQAPVWPGGK